MASFWEYIPVVSTAGHAIQEGWAKWTGADVCNGMQQGDYIAHAARAAACTDDPNSASATAERERCKKEITATLAGNLTSCVGGSAAPYMNQVANMIIGGISLATIPIVGPNPVNVGLAIIMGIDGIVDFAILQSRLERIGKAAKAAVASYCKCPGDP